METPEEEPYEGWRFRLREWGSALVAGLATVGCAVTGHVLPRVADRTEEPERDRR